MSSIFGEGTGAGRGGGSIYGERQGPPPTTRRKKKDEDDGGLLGAAARYSGLELTGNLLRDIGTAAVGLGPGAVKTGSAIVREAQRGDQGLLAYALGRQGKSPFLEEIVKPTIESYKEYYGHDVLSHLYEHPLQPILDVATVASVGAGAAAKAGLVSKGRGVIEVRSPRAKIQGKGPTEKRLTSEKPLVRGREKLVARVRSEEKQYGKGVQRKATRRALGYLGAYAPYYKATKRLRENQWAALYIRALDTHPDDLAQLWKGTPNEKLATNEEIRKLVLEPNEKILNAEKQSRLLSAQGATLARQTGALSEESMLARPELFKIQASEALGRQVKPITGNPYYFPHALDPAVAKNPLITTGGGKGPPRGLGTMKRNLGTLSLSGKLHLRSDVLGPEFLRRITWVKHDEIWRGLKRGAVRVRLSEIEDTFGGRMPKGYEYLRQSPKTRVPHAIRGEGDVPIETLVPDPDDLSTSPLGEGFTTNDLAQAAATGDRADPVYYLIPKETSRAATGEFTRADAFTRAFIQTPLKWWRSIVLGLRPGYLTNNLVGNSVMYGVRTTGRGALRDLIMAVYETHGRETAERLLNDPVTPPALRDEVLSSYAIRAEQEGLTRLQRAGTRGDGSLRVGGVGDRAIRGAAQFTRATSPEDLTAFRAETGRTERPGYVTEPDLADLARSKVFRSPDGKSGFYVTPEGDLRGVHRSADGTPGSGAWGVLRAIEEGAVTLDAYEGLIPFYQRFGFEPVARQRWDDAHAPKGWDYEAEGRPDLVHMALAAPRREDVPYFDDWQEAKDYTLAQVVEPPRPTDFYQEFFPEQVAGTFGRTQSPAATPMHVRGRAVSEVARAVTGVLPRVTSKVAEEYPRRGLIRNMIRNSPEFKAVYQDLPKQTRSFETAARQMLTGRGGKALQERVSRDVNNALGNYLDLSPAERGVLRNALPFYAWYRAILTVTGHLVADTPGRALILSKLGELGEEWTAERLGEVPSFLRNAVPLGPPRAGSQQVIATGGLNPYATVEGLARGATTDISQLGLNPFAMAALEAYARSRRNYQPVSPADLASAALWGQVGRNLPLTRLAFPQPPSKLYPYRSRQSEFLSYLGVPIKRYDISTARQQAREGR